MTPATVVAVSRDHSHRFSKPPTDEITLLAGLGVEGDAHAGTTVKHRSRVARDPSQPNLRQVHLMHAELHEELRGQGFAVEPGQLGENHGEVVRRAGIMGIVLSGGPVRPGDQITVELPAEPHARLDVV